MHFPNITLIGMPGSGKSTVGKILAKRIGFEFVDVDDLIEKGAGVPLSKIISKRGDDGFIELETQVICALNDDNRVYGPGGSAVLSDTAMSHFKEISKVVYLSASVGTLKSRLSDLVLRGVVHSKDKTLNQLYEQRVPLYENYADFKVETDNKTPQVLADEIIEVLDS